MLLQCGIQLHLDPSASNSTLPEEQTLLLHHSQEPQLQVGRWRAQTCPVEPARSSLQVLFTFCHHFLCLEGCCVTSAVLSLPLLHMLSLFAGFQTPPLHSWSSPSSCSKPGSTMGWQSQKQQLWALLSPCSEMERPQPGCVAPQGDKDGTGVLNCLSAGCEASKRESMINSPRESEAQSAG